MTTHSSILAWRIPWSEESGGLQSLGLRKVGHDWGLISVTSITHLGSGDINSSTHTIWMTINRRPFLKKKERFFYIDISQFLDLFFWVTLSSTKIMHGFIQEYIHSLKFMTCWWRGDRCSSTIFFFWLHHAARRTLVPWPGVEPAPPAVEGRVLTTGWPGKSQHWSHS